MKAIPGNNRRRDPQVEQRRGLLAKVHIAIKELCLPEDDYRALLDREFGKRSAAKLTIIELQYLVFWFEEHGWRPKRENNKGTQIRALQARAYAVAAGLDNGARRLRGLTWSMCGVESIDWCRDVRLLKRVVATLNKITGR